MTRKDFEKLTNIGIFKKPDIEVVEDTINLLIENLYKPCDDERMKDGVDFVADDEKLKLHNINNEPINWGDLKVCNIEKKGESFFVTVDEAAPGCQNLIFYIEKFMKLWGWDVEVETEW